MKEKEKQLPEKMREGQTPRAEFVPQVDIYEMKEAILIYCDLPGVSQDQLEITLEQQELTIRGEQQMQQFEELDNMKSEYATGLFRRSFKVPQAIDDTNITARLNNGVLELTLAKAKEALPKKITVQAA
jgi:HSP20 family protein